MGFEKTVENEIRKRKKKDNLKFKVKRDYVPGPSDVLNTELVVYDKQGNYKTSFDFTPYYRRYNHGEFIGDIIDEIYQECLKAVGLEKKETQEIQKQQPTAVTSSSKENAPESIEQLKEMINKLSQELSGLSETVDLTMNQMSAKKVSEIPQRLFVDIDGTLAVFRQIDTLELLYEEGYFLNLEPIPEVIAAVKEIVRNHPDKEVYIMSSVLSDSHYALKEKNQWLDKYLPEIDDAHRIFPTCGENKLDYVPDGIRENDCLLDDYTNNLVLWEPPAKGIKLLNEINHTKGTWKKSALRYNKSPEELASDIVSVMDGQVIRDPRPQEKQMEYGLSTKPDKSPQIRAPRR